MDIKVGTDCAYCATGAISSAGAASAAAVVCVRVNNERCK